LYQRCLLIDYQLVRVQMKSPLEITNILLVKLLLEHLILREFRTCRQVKLPLELCRQTGYRQYHSIFCPLERRQVQSLGGSHTHEIAHITNLASSLDELHSHIVDLGVTSLKLIRSRGATDNLTGVGTGTTAGSVTLTESVNIGDTLADRSE